MKISILGLGAYGIALANAFCINDNKVSMWTKYKEEADIVLLKRENPILLPNVKLHNSIDIYTDLKKCITDSDIIVIAVPISAVREVSIELASIIDATQVICIASKGIENDSYKLMSEVVFEETKNNNICILSGPSFAQELANNIEVGLVVASEMDTASMTVKVCLENDKISINTTKDIMGVQVAAATKNVFAILMGIADGLGKGDSTKAAILTNCINDQRFIIEALGGQPQTIFSYAGIGDMLLTCLSTKSRNYFFGKLIGESKTVNEALDSMTVTTVEGLHTLDALVILLKDRDISINSINMLYGILYNGQKVTDILRYI